MPRPGNAPVEGQPPSTGGPCAGRAGRSARSRVWIARDNPAAARGLRNAAVKAARRIGTNPLIGAIRPKLGADRFRFLLLRGYPYLAVYTADTDPPRILRVLHTARDLPRILAETGT